MHAPLSLLVDDLPIISFGVQLGPLDVSATENASRFQIGDWESTMLCPSCGHENIDGTDRCDNCLSPFRDLDVPNARAAEGLARSVMSDNLGRLDQEETISVAPETPAIDVVKFMKNSNSGCALVLNHGRLAGIFTEHDVLRKMTGPEARSPATAVSELMSPNPEVLQERDSVATALNKMSIGRYRHIPVRKDDGSYTVTSIKSVLKYIAKEDW